MREFAGEAVDAAVDAQAQAGDLVFLVLHLLVALLAEGGIDEQEDEEDEQQRFGQREAEDEAAPIADWIVGAAHQLTRRTMVFARSPRAE